MIRAKKILMDNEEHSLSILAGFPLFHVDRSVNVCEHHRETLIHHCNVNLESISLKYSLGINVDILCHKYFMTSLMGIFNNG